MVVLDPQQVELSGAALSGVRSITIGRTPERLLEEWQDGGPFCIFADVARLRVTVKVVRWVGASELGAAVEPGEVSTLRFSVTGDGTASQRVQVQCVCSSVTHEAGIAESSGRMPSGVVQKIELRGVSFQPDDDPVVFSNTTGV